MTPSMRIWGSGPLPSPVFLTQPHLGLVSSSLCVCLLSRVWLCDPTDCSSPGPSVHGILQSRRLEWVAISSSRGSSPPGIEPRFSYIDRRILYHCPPWESLASPFGDWFSLDVPDWNKKHYPSAAQGSLTCSFRLAAKCKTRSRGMLWHSTISVIGAGAGSFIRASGGQLPSPTFKPGLCSPEAGRALDTAALLSPKHLSGDGVCSTQSSKRNKKARFSHRNHLRRARTVESSLSLRSTWKQISLYFVI